VCLLLNDVILAPDRVWHSLITRFIVLSARCSKNVIKYNKFLHETYNDICVLVDVCVWLFITMSSLQSALRRWFDLMSSIQRIHSGIVCSTWFQCSSSSERACTWRGSCRRVYVLHPHLVHIRLPVSQDVVLVLLTLRLCISGKIFCGKFHLSSGSFNFHSRYSHCNNSMVIMLRACSSY